MIQAQCPHCNKIHKAPDDKKGRSGRCSCGQKFTIEEMDPPPAAPVAQKPKSPPQGSQDKRKMKMGYIENNLMTDEEVLYKGQIHWFIFTKPISLLLVGIIFMFASADNMGILLIGFGFILVAASSGVLAAILYLTTELGVTNKRVITKKGIIARKTFELLNGKVEGVQVDQSVFGRLFNFGTVTIQGTGGGNSVMKSIEDPVTFRNEFSEAVEK